MRLEHLHGVSLEKLVDRVFRVLEVNELSCTGWAGLAAGGREALRDPVIAKRALVRHFPGGMNVAASIWARLHAIGTACLLYTSRCV